jgi:tetraacyldisaccharide 4'-kinase
VETSSAVAEVGDEPLQIKRKFPDIHVSVCENRVDGVKQLLKGEKQPIPDVVVLDDAFQHRRISPGINILLIDYNRPIKEDRLLPAGRLREGAYQIRRANIILFTKCPEEVTPIMQRILQKDVQLKPYQKLYFTKFVYQNIEPVFNAKILDEKFYQNKNYSILVITGIASPELVQKYLGKLAKSIETLVFPDHYNFTEADIEQIQAKFLNLKNTNKIIVTTEKDSMRLKERADIPEDIKSALYFLPIKVEFLGKENKSFNKRILDYVGENKSNRELHKRKNTSKS